MPPSRSSYDLVSFANPPVVEVALSVQFGAESISLEVIGLLAAKVRKSFPRQEQQPVLPSMVETFDLAPKLPSFEVRFEPAATLPRIWLLSADGRDLLQVQHDRLSLNWRQLDADVPYPRYPYLRRRLAQLHTTLTECIRSTGALRPVPNLCEVAYVNPIEYGSTPATKRKQHPELSSILKLVRRHSPNAFLPQPEDMQVNARWRIPSPESKTGQDPVGRLSLATSPALKAADHTPIYMMNLTARVIPRAPHRSSVLAALDLGHEWVVRGFKDLTTDRVQRHWQLDDEEVM